MVKSLPRDLLDTLATELLDGGPVQVPAGYDVDLVIDHLMERPDLAMVHLAEDSLLDGNVLMA